MNRRAKVILLGAGALALLIAATLSLVTPGKVLVLDTVAELIALDPYAFAETRSSAQISTNHPRRLRVVTRGRDAAGDGGGAAFDWIDASSATTNYGTCFAVTTGRAGRFVWDGVGPLRPAMFGAFGIAGNGESIVYGANSTFSQTNTYGFQNSSTPVDWTALTNSAGVAPAFEAAYITNNRLRLTLRASPSGAHQIALPSTRMSSYMRAEDATVWGFRFLGRTVSGTAREMRIGKDAAQSATFTLPLGSTMVTNTGTFTVNTTNVGSLTIMLATQADANGSVYEFDEIELFPGVSDVNRPEEAPDESVELTAFHNAIGDGQRAEYGHDRIYRSTTGNLRIPPRASVDVNGSLVLFDIGTAPDNGFELDRGATLRNFYIAIGVTGFVSNSVHLQVPIAVGRQSDGDLKDGVTIEDGRIYSNADHSQYTYGILAHGIYNSTIRNIRFEDSTSVRRLINVVWSGANLPLTLGIIPSFNNTIEQIYSDYSGQYFTTHGGGAVVSLNGVFGTTVRGVYGNLAGRSLVTIAPGDYAFESMWTQFMLGGNVANIVEGCEVYNASIGLRVQGDTTFATPPSWFQVIFRGNTVRGDGGPAGYFNDSGGIQIEGGVSGSVEVHNNDISGFLNGIRIDGAVDPVSGVNAHVNTIRGALDDGIYVRNAENIRLTDNTIYGVGLNATNTAGIRLDTAVTNIFITGNLLGALTGEASMQYGVLIDSDATITGVHIDDNHTRTLLAGGSAYSLGASAGYAVKGLNYSGTAIVAASLANHLGEFAATTSAQLRTTLSDESGTGAALFADGAIGAATATTPSAADNDTSVATTAFVQTELANRSTIWIDAGAMAPFATDGATAVTTTLTTNGVPVDEYSFDAATDKKTSFKLSLPPGWNGSTLTAKFYWRTTATSGNCVWTIAGIFARDGDNPDVTAGTAQSVTDGAQGTANFQSITSATSTITPAGTYGSGTTLYFVVTRDADNGSDTLASAALLDGVLLTWK